MEKLKAIFAASLAIALPFAAQADGLRARLDFGSVFDWNTLTSADAAFGFQNRQSYDANLRLLWDKNAGPLSFEVQTILSYNMGDNLDYNTVLSGLFPTPPTTFFDLTLANADGSFALRVDRLSVGYASDHLVLKIGRQAVTWGGGFVFHPTDIVAPFPPNAQDTAYKPGVDMIYAQYLFDSGADIQAILVPRPAMPNGPIDWNQSTFALQGTAFIGDLDTNVIIGQDHGDTLISMGLSGPLGGAAWHVEYAQWFLNGGGSTNTILANLTNSGSLFNHNITYFAEYFHNGFGVSSDVPLDALPASLTARLSTGNLFNAGRDFLAIGAQFDLTADIMLAPNTVISLNDGSALIGLQASWTIDDNMDLQVGYHQPIGADGTEFGGRETTLGSGTYLRPASELSLKLARFF